MPSEKNESGMTRQWTIGDPLDQHCGHARPQDASQLHGVCIFCWRDRAGALERNRRAPTLAVSREGMPSVEECIEAFETKTANLTKTVWANEVRNGIAAVRSLIEARYKEKAGVGSSPQTGAESHSQRSCHGPTEAVPADAATAPRPVAGVQDSPTPALPLAALIELERAATPRPWMPHGVRDIDAGHCIDYWTIWGSPPGADRDLIVALRNALPSIIEALRERDECIRIAGDALGTDPSLRGPVCVDALAAWCKTLQENALRSSRSSKAPATVDVRKLVRDYYECVGAGGKNPTHVEEIWIRDMTHALSAQGILTTPPPRSPEQGKKP